MKTKTLTATENLLKIYINSEMRKRGITSESATIAQKVQLVSIEGLQELPKKIRIDKEDCWKYIQENNIWNGYGNIDDIPEEINSRTLYVGWIYKDEKHKHAVCFKNRRFGLREKRLITEDIARMYLVEKFLQEKGYSTTVMYLDEDTVESVKNSIFEEMFSN